MVKGYQYATQRMKYARVPVVAAPYGMTLGGGLELCFGVRRGAGGGRDLLGPRRGRRRPHPRRRRHAEHAVARARERSPRASTSTRTRSSRRRSRTSRSRRSRRQRRGGARRSATSARPTACRSTARASSPRRSSARSASRTPAITRRSPRAYKLPGESGIATLQMMVNTLVAGGTRASTTRRSR